MADHADDAAPVDPAYGEILSPTATSRLNTSAARARVWRLVRGGDISPELLPSLTGH